MMSELSREQVEAHLDVLDCSLSPKASKDSKLKLLATDAALRAKLDEQTKRVEKAERELGIRQEAFSRATQRHIAKCVTIADITAKLEAMTQDRNAYQKIAADWASAADLSQQADDFYEGYSEKTMRAMQALLTRSQQQLAASEQRFQAAENERIEWVQRGERAEQRVRELEESQLAWGAELSRYKVMVLETERQCDQLQATVTAQQEEIGRLREALEVGTYRAGANEHPKEFERWVALLDEGLMKSFDLWFMGRALASGEAHVL